MSSQSIQKKVEMLTRQMAEAAAAEDFERAAALRNEIEELKGPTVRQPHRRGRWGWAPNIPVAAPPRAGRARRNPIR